MDSPRDFGDAGQQPIHHVRGAEVTATVASFSLIGGVGGIGVAELIVKPLAYPGENEALSQAGSAVQAAKNKLWTDTQQLPSAVAGLGEHDPMVTQLRAQISTDSETVVALQTAAAALPNHSHQLGAGGLGLGVAAGLIACGIKFGIQKLHTGRATRN